MIVQPVDFLNSDIRGDSGSAVVFSVGILNKHLGAIVFALKNNKGMLPNDELLHGIIADLSKANLGMLIDSNKSFLLSEQVASLIRNFENQGASRVGVADVADLLERVEEAIADYFEFTSLSNQGDAGVAFQNIEELVSRLSQLLLNVFSGYSTYVFRDLSRFNSYKIKIKKIERAMSGAEKLEGLISKITMDYVVKQSRGNQALYVLLRNELYSIVDVCLSYFISSGHEMRSAMYRWQVELDKGVKRNELVDDLAAYFSNGGVLGITVDEHIMPNCLFEAEKVKSIAYFDFSEPELYSVDRLVSYIHTELKEHQEGEVVKKHRDHQNQIRMSNDVEDGNFEGVMPYQEFYQHLDTLFMTFQDGDVRLKALSARDAYSVFKPDYSIGTWLSEIVLYFNSKVEKHKMFSESGRLAAANEIAFYKNIKLTYVEDPVPNFDGNWDVQDILIERK